MVGTPPHQLFPSNQLEETPVQVVVVEVVMETIAFELNPAAAAIQPRLSVTAVRRKVVVTAGLTEKL
jgi:hypothetical protein